MILSASRRTDIPALYSDWLFEQIKNGYFLVPSPLIETGKIAKIKVEPVKVHTNILGGREVSGNVDGIVFWTKNPRPMMARLDELKDFIYVFLFTLNAYDEKIEKQVPSLDERIKTFQELSQKIGTDKVIWRYDPIFLNKEIDIEWHIKNFRNLASQLNGFTKICHIAFLIEGKCKNLKTPDYLQMNEILKNLSQIAREHEIQLFACAQKCDWSKYGIKSSKCIDPDFWSKLLGAKVKTKRLDGTRKNCGCMPCVDIGIYNTCTHGCLYCYANGFYGYRGEPKSMSDKLDGEIYERKSERIFEY